LNRRIQLLLLVLFLAEPGLAQKTPGWEFYGGYSLERSDMREYYKSTPIIYTFRDQSINLNGWEASVTENLNKHFGGTVQVTGHYKTPVVLGTTNSESMLSLLYGPRISHRMSWGTPFGQVLFGVQRVSVAVTPVGPHIAETAFAVAAGAGLDVNLGSKTAIRVLQLQYSPMNPVGTKKSKFQISAGVVFYLGQTK
jgi:hypothetical protein